MKKKLPLIEKALPELRKLFIPCRLCGHKCSVNRQKDELGICHSRYKPSVYNYSPHHGEEPPVSGSRGSGTIFFTRCNMKCVYCQNYKFSQEPDRIKPLTPEITVEKLAQKMLELEEMGCHNINLVSPTHYACQIVEALKIATQSSLDIPIVYNTGGYDSPRLIKLLDGIVDIYLVDMRYAEPDMAKKYSSAPDYVETNRLILKEMFRQVGVLKTDENGVGKKGVIVRLLILPNNISGTTRTLKFLQNEVSGEIFLSVMSQYHPAYKAENHPEIARTINRIEYRDVVKEVENLGFTNGWIQGFITDTKRFLGTNIKPANLQ